MQVDKQHYTVDLENEWVRVLRVSYQPGEGSPMHEHTAGVRVFLTDIRNRFTNADGTSTETSRRAGEIIWSEKVRHANTMLSQAPVAIIELELKRGPAGPAKPMPKTSSPDPAEEVLIENDAVRVLRAEVPAGGEMRAHRHPASVAITVKPKPAVLWNANGPHALKNAGPDSLTVVIVEIKPR